MPELRQEYVVHFDFDTLVEELDATAIVTGLASI